ncbi:MAG: VOC family protein, partial [Kordia sp.]|uniref:VOC family protein n=1 Tax=Kordia sp. TaxID=1965332 RepID=UPI00385C4513
MQINELTLFTTNLEAQKHFYTQVLELPLVAASAGTFTIKVGASSLTFVTSEHTNPAHFAFAISSNKIQQALEWT